MQHRLFSASLSLQSKIVFTMSWRRDSSFAGWDTLGRHLAGHFNATVPTDWSEFVNTF